MLARSYALQQISFIHLCWLNCGTYKRKVKCPNSHVVRKGMPGPVSSCQLQHLKCLKCSETTPSISSSSSLILCCGHSCKGKDVVLLLWHWVKTQKFVLVLSRPLLCINRHAKPPLLRNKQLWSKICAAKIHAHFINFSIATAKYYLVKAIRQ